MHNENTPAVDVMDCWGVGQSAGFTYLLRVMITADCRVPMKDGAMKLKDLAPCDQCNP